MRRRSGGSSPIPWRRARARRADGSVREDILRLVAMNQMTELDDLLLREPEMRPLVEALAAHRLNFTDRRITQME